MPDARRLFAAEPLLAAACSTYHPSPALLKAVREDAGLRFAGLSIDHTFAAVLASRAVRFIDDVATARYVQRF